MNATFGNNIRNIKDHVERFSIFHLRQHLFAFKAHCMEMRLPSIFKTTNVSKLNKTILESSYRVLQVASKWKTLKWPVYILGVVAFWATFHIQIDITLPVFWEKLQNYTSEKAYRSFSKHANIYINMGSHYEILAL